jgi:2-oxoglutarate ferredoxin oxidoreductase subunit beta
MPSVTTGANLANRDLMFLGVSGDGDTASIGMGQFVHAIRRGLNMVYIVMNNGCYGLTKGQDSATADIGSVSKSGSVNHFQNIDLVGLALELGATYVGRSFSGDKGQLVPMIKAGLTHRGFALIDVISPCVTFNNNPGSTKSYDYVRAHMEATSSIDLVPVKEEITVDYEAGSTKRIEMHDHSILELHKLAEGWDPTDRTSALNRLNESRMKGEILTGLLFVDPNAQDLHDIIETVSTPLNQLTEAELCPGNDMLEKINAEHR